MLPNRPLVLRIFLASFSVALIAFWVGTASFLFPLAVFFLILASLLGCGWTMRIMTRPLEPLTQALGRSIDDKQDPFVSQAKELQFKLNQAQAMLESLVEGVVALDREGYVLWMNTSAQQLFGFNASASQPGRLTDFFRQTELADLLQEVSTKQQRSIRELRLFAPVEQMIRFQVTPCQEGAGQTALVLVAQDVTEMRRLEGMRREFVANVSHELKTPLTSIKGLVETLLGGAVDDASHNRRFLTMIEHDATRLGRLIDDLLELSQIESKAIPLTLQNVSLQAFVDGVVLLFRDALAQRKIVLEVLIADELPPVTADPERLRQVLINLIDNAIKFNKPGGKIFIRAHHEGNVSRIEVEDTGIGIPKESLPRIFERFYRVDKARSRELGGTGLGLSIVKHLIEAHRGQVSVTSQLGQGSIFTITLPVAS
ncbi:MAG: PAS domain-containing protein [Candidatus Omnitrophica bacterium]|nr:PAS domain-containing protein [Candidatus Omnitrophota bacterium]